MAERTGTEDGAPASPRTPAPAGWAAPDSGSAPPPASPAPPDVAPPPPGWPAPPPGWPPPPAGWPAAPPGWAWGWPAPPPLPKAGSARTGPLPLHPMTVSDVLDGAFKLFKANARTVLTVTALFVVPIQVLAAFLQRDLLGGQSFLDVVRDPSTARAAQDAGGNGQALAGVVALAATVLVLPFVAGAVSRVVAASYLGEQLEPGPALRATRRRFWALTGAWVLVHLAEIAGWLVLAALVAAAFVTGGSVLFIALAVVAGLGALVWQIVASVLYTAVAPAIVVEELGPVRAMRRSFGLLRRRFWGVLGIVVLAGILTSILGNVLGFVPEIGALLIGTGRGGWVLLAVGGILSSLVTTPLVAIVATLVYFDARIRQEGFDLQVIADDLARGGLPG